MHDADDTANVNYSTASLWFIRRVHKVLHRNSRLEYLACCKRTGRVFINQTCLIAYRTSFAAFSHQSTVRLRVLNLDKFTDH